MGQILEDVRLLVVEDEFLSAMELARMIAAFGGTVVGPVGELAQAQELARSQCIDGAILDVQLDGESGLVLAAELMERAIPVVLATGFDRDMLPAHFADTPRLGKPFNDADFRRVAEQHFRRSPTGD